MTSADLPPHQLDLLLERQKLLERLTKIQRSISHRDSLKDVLDAITAGAAELLEDEVVGLRLIDPDDPAYMVMVSTSGVKKSLTELLRRRPVGQGAGGRAIVENSLVVIESYYEASDALPEFAAERLQTAMAAPVHEEGKVVGSLTVASYKPGRSYSKAEQEVLLAFAEHVSLALTDAKTVHEMREAERTKDMFLAMVSHELKTPLTVIMGTLHTLQRHEKRLPKAVRDELLEAAFERGQELEKLIDRLLKGARAELAGARHEVFLPDLVADAASGFEGSRALTIGTIPELLISVDAGAVHDVVGILLENAVAHSPQGTAISVDAAVEGTAVTITVSNEGTLPESVDRADLFQPFRRGTDESSGVGLGLYIAARLAETLDGDLSVDSAEGIVSFSLRFPIISFEEGPSKESFRSLSTEEPRDATR